MSQKEIRALFQTHASNLVTAINELDNDELEQALEVARNYSITNCWWVEYQMKSAFINLIESRINTLKTLNKQSTP